LLFSKELYSIAFDQEMAEASGVPARRMFFLLLTLVALTVVVSLKTVGAILVFAMVLIPASTAYQLTHSLSTLTWYSLIIGIVCLVTGVLLSALWDIPSGPSIVLLSTCVFFTSVLFSPTRSCLALATRSHPAPRRLCTIGIHRRLLVGPGKNSVDFARLSSDKGVLSSHSIHRRSCL